MYVLLHADRDFHKMHAMFLIPFVFFHVSRINMYKWQFRFIIHVQRKRKHSFDSEYQKEQHVATDLR